MLTLLKYFKKWVLGLFFKVQRPLPETPSGEIKSKGTDSLNELVRGFEDNKPAIQREVWFQTANNLMDADFDVKDSWYNHGYIPDSDQLDETLVTEVLVTKIGRFKDEVGETKYEPHRDSKPKTALYTKNLTNEVAKVTEEIFPSYKSQEAIDHLNYLKEHPEHPDNDYDLKRGRYAEYPRTPSESHNKSNVSDSTDSISINMGTNGALGDD